jgi:hypothetical protein
LWNRIGGKIKIVTRALFVHLFHQTGFKKKEAPTWAVTLIQRFGSALNLNMYLTCMDALMPWVYGCAGTAHVLFLDGVYVSDDSSNIAFHCSKAPTVNAGASSNELTDCQGNKKAN